MKSLSGNACKCIKIYKSIKDEITFLRPIFFATFNAIKTMKNLFFKTF